MTITKFSSLALLLLICLWFSTIPGYSYYQNLRYQSRQSSYRDKPDWFDEITPSEYPEKIDTAAAPEISAEGMFIIDVDSAVPLYEKNPHKQLYPASTSKIMTALVSLETYKLDDVLNVPDASYSGSVMRLVKGERISVDNLLYGLLVNSGNDAAEVLAYHYPSGRLQFISRMNQKAVELGLRGTHFVNPSGLPDPQQVMSAWDLGQLAAYAMHNADFRRYVSTKERTVYGVNGGKHTLKSTNQLLGEIEGLDGVKTGYTEDAGEVLVSTVVRGGHRVVIVVLKSADRFGETKRLVDWVFATHDWRSVR